MCVYVRAFLALIFLAHRAQRTTQQQHKNYERPPPGVAGGLGWYAASTGNQISSRLLSARSANALLELPRAEGVLAAGTEVSALLIDDVGAMPVVAGEPVPPTEGFC